jgi:TatD DNase family protein
LAPADGESSPVRYFDTHSHLFQKVLSDDLEGVLLRARRAGVERILVPGLDAGTSRAAAAIASGHDGVRAAAGIHPSSLAEARDADFAAVVRLMMEPDVIAVGETGLDFFRDGAPREVQREWLQRHVDLAEGLGYPLILHSRSAEEEVLDELPATMGVPVIMHCFTGSVEAAEKAACRGFYVGIAGPVTYRTGDRTREIARRLPGDRILVETDSPYLAPVPFRGQASEPSMVGMTAAAVASARGEDPESTAAMLWDNSLAAFMDGSGSGRRTDLLYRLGSSLYANITGNCNCDCAFCLRFSTDGLAGYRLEHSVEPAAERLRAGFRMLGPGWFDEVVFCGFGEPTTRPGLLAELADIARGRGYPTRLDTNGLVLELMDREAAGRLLSHFDSVSISLNEASAEGYGRICRTAYEDPWSSLMEFVLLARDSGCRTNLTAVRFPGVDLEGAAALAARLGIPYRTRG